MSSRPIPTDLLPWALSSLRLPQGEPGPGLAIVAGDASNRRYFRLDPGGSSFIVAEAPPETENNEAEGAAPTETDNTEGAATSPVEKVGEAPAPVEETEPAPTDPAPDGDEPVEPAGDGE